MIIGADTETHPLKPGLLAPRMVCLSYAGNQYACADDLPGVVLRPQGLELLRGWLLDTHIVLAIHNAPFDLGVACAEDPSLLPLVFEAYREHRVRCTIVRQMLIDVALGMREWRRVGGQVSRASYGLADLVQLYYGEHLEKEDTWRLRYALLDGVPVEEWPQDARDYAIKDAVEHLRVYEAQEREIVELWGELPNQAEQQRASWALHLMSMWGIRADATAVDRFVAHCEEEIVAMHEALEDTGIFKPDGSRTMSVIRDRVVQSLTRMGVQVPRTEPSAKFPDGQVKTDKEVLELTDDPSLHVLAESMSFAKHLGQWGPVLRAATQRPVCCRYTVLVKTGRTASSGSEGQEGTNIQNPPRNGDVRPCIIPRTGNVFGLTDADTIELRAHAQNCLELVGWSRTADHLIKQSREGGPDLHEVLAAGLLNLAPEEVQARVRGGDKETEETRQFAKIPGYGFPGGLGAPTFVSFAAKQMKRPDFLRRFGTNLDDQVATAKRHRAVWFEMFPENREYFRIVGDMIGDASEGTVIQLLSGRIRGGTRFTAAANGFFQGRVADAEKECLFRLAYECYLGRCSTCWGAGCLSCASTGRSVLLGSRPAMFLHDEPILEHPEATAADRVERQRLINEECLNKWMPDVPCTSGAVIVRRWFKGAKPMKVDGKLVPVRPEKFTAADGKPRVRWVQDLGETERRAA